MTEFDDLYAVQMVHNDYHKMGELGGPHGKRPEWVYYCKGPGGPGPHGFLLMPQLYFDTYEEAQRAIPLLVLAYRTGRYDKMEEIKKVMEID